MLNTNKKTPTSILLELSAKNRWISQYTVNSDSNNGFQCRLILNGQEVLAYGTSKQKAKHNASGEMIKILSKDEKINSSGKDTPMKNEPTQIYTNYVGRLQELTQKQKLPQPEYSLVTDVTSNLAICTVKLLQLSKIGSDINAKLAKHKAALAMLEELEIAISQPDVNRLSNELQIINLIEDDDSSSLIHSQSQSVNQMTPPANENTTMRLSRLCPNIVHASMYQQILDDIAHIHKFEVTPVSLSEQTEKGLYQCLLQLSTYPVSIFHGKGLTRDEAYAAAILNSISYLKYIIKMM